MKKIRIVLLDDHLVITEGIKAMFANHNKFEILRTFNSAKNFIKELDEINFEILITDLSMPEICGLSVIKDLRKRHPKLKTVVLSMFNDDIAMHEAYKNGANGYINKSADKSEIELVLQQILENKTVFPEHIIIDQSSATNKKAHTLSTRELEILKLVAEGFSSKDIANKLFLSEFTVNTHRRNMLKKTGASNLAALIKLGQENRWIL